MTTSVRNQALFERPGSHIERFSLSDNTDAIRHYEMLFVCTVKALLYAQLLLELSKQCWCELFCSLVASGTVDDIAPAGAVSRDTLHLSQIANS